MSAPISWPLRNRRPEWRHLPLELRAAANRALWDLLQEPDRVARLHRAARLVLARSIPTATCLDLLLRDPARYGPLLRLRLLGGRPEVGPLF